VGVIFASLAASLDGYIASTSGDLAWLNDSMRRDEDYGFAETMKRTGAYVMGAKTHREAAGMGSGKSEPPTFVLTHADPGKAPSGVTFVSGDVRAVIEAAQSVTERDVYIFGGGDVLTQAIAADALDELTIAVVPVLLGGGTRLFGSFDRTARLRLAECRSFDSGIVALRYERPT
jgi:dihydrofolate reductase